MPTSSATVETAPIHQPDVWSQIVVTVVKYWVWFLVGFIALVIIVSIILIIKRMKKHIDPFADEYKKVKSLCKFQRDPTIKSVYMMSDQGLKYLGHYLGEAISHDGFRNILLWRFKKWYLFWFPTFLDFFDIAKEMMVVRCNQNNEFVYAEYDQDTKEEKKVRIKLNIDVFTKTEDKILIRGFGLERVRYFMYPVLRDKEGNIVDRSMEIFERERNPALISTMYQQAEDFANVSRELINLNPSVRYTAKTGESPSKKPE